jgi:hypothetical protein
LTWLVRSLCAGLILVAISCASRTEIATAGPLFDVPADASPSDGPTCDVTPAPAPLSAAECRGNDPLFGDDVGAASPAGTAQYDALPNIGVTP